MNTPHCEELVSRLLDGELSERDSECLARLMSEDESLRRDVQQHLALWELWSQHQAPERSAEAFVRAWRTRLRAEAEGADAFSGEVRAHLEARQRRPGVGEFFRQWITVRRPASLAWAASLLIMGLALLFWFAVPHSAQAVTTIKGEAVCTACTLHESQQHAPAVRVITGGVTNVYYLIRNSAVAGLQDYFCAGPAPVTVQGKPEMKAGRHLFDPSTVTVPATNGPPETMTNDAKVIFPI